MKNGRLVRFVCLGCCWLALVSLEASAGYWRARDLDVARRDFELESMYMRYELERLTTPAGATIPKNKSLTVPYTRNRIFDLAKKAKKASPVNLAMTAAVTAVGWSIDELTKEVTEPNWIDPPMYESGYAWVTSGYHASMPDVSCQLWGDAISRPYTSITYYSSTRYNCNTKATPGGNTATYNTNKEADTLCTGAYCDPPEQIEGTPTVVPDPEVVDQVMPYLIKLPDYQIDDIYKDERDIPLTTTELRDAINAYNQDLADSDPNLTWDPITGTFTYTDPVTLDETVWDADSVVNEDLDNTASDQDKAGDELPGFCDWAVAVCDWFAWTQEEFEPPPPEDLPYEEMSASDFERSYSSGLGSGSCPAPIAFSYGTFSGEYKFDTACSAISTYFYPILLMMAGIMAAFIITGATRKGD